MYNFLLSDDCKLINVQDLYFIDWRVGYLIWN